MAAGNLYLLLKKVAGEFDYFHAVKQRGIDGREGVGRGDEQDFRQIVVKVDVIVVEGGVLFRVEDLEQCRSGVALVVASEFVDFVKQEHGVCDAGFLHGLDYAAGHCADVGAPVSAYFSLVMYATERHALVFAAHGFGH